MFELRAATQDDRPLIFATWLRSYRHGSQTPRRIPDAVYFARHHELIEELLDLSDVRIAHPVGEPEVILGWSVVEVLEPDEIGEPSPAVVHFVYVKPPFRRAGVARALLAHVDRLESSGSPVLYTHETFTLKAEQLAAHVARWTFDPYLAIRRDWSDSNERRST
jgi:GNAT superfamily N-acetyltransferase